MPPPPTPRNLILATATAVVLAALVGALVHYLEARTDSGLRPLATLTALGDGEEVTDFTLEKRPEPAPAFIFADGAGRRIRLADFRGRVTLVNFWATWCAPCRGELGALDHLQARLGGADFEVVALAVDDGGPEAVRAFFAELGIETLDVYVDPRFEALDALALPGLPTSLLLDREGRIVARLYGARSWDRAPVVAFLDDYVERSLAARESLIGAGAPLIEAGAP